MRPTAVLFYDGNCALCHGAVRWALRQNRLADVYFSPLQGKTAQTHLPKELAADLNTVVFWENAQIYTEATAVFRLWQLCGGFWKLLSVFQWLPKGLSNSIYRLIATNRFRFRKPLVGCPLPNAKQKSRFLN